MQTVNLSQSPTIKFLTLGCKVNQYDTQAIREKFLSQGFYELDNGYPADIYVINTCTVTHRVDAECFSLIRRVKKESPQAKIIVTGCLTELDEDSIQAVHDKVIIVKNRDKENILEHLSFLNGPNGHNGPNELNKHSRITYFKGHTRAFLKIQDGCNNFCSYCKVPLVRGNSQSKPLLDIIAEAVGLVNSGAKEIVLCGICLGAYGRDLPQRLNLIEVIEALEKIAGLLRIRLSSIEAGDISDELIQKIYKSKKLCRHLHIPLQSGDDNVLKKMNRKYSRADFLKLILKIKRNIPDIAITTDVLVGFPQEQGAHFRNTVEAIKKILPLKVHIFPYSLREGTAAFNFKDKINPRKIKERILYLKEIARECAFVYRRKFLNKRMDVLLEGRVKKAPYSWEGFTTNYIKVYVKSEQDLKNKLIPLNLKKIGGDFVFADLC